MSEWPPRFRAPNVKKCAQFSYLQIGTVFFFCHKLNKITCAVPKISFNNVSFYIFPSEQDIRQNCVSHNSAEHRKIFKPENFVWCSNVGNINLRLSPNTFPYDPKILSCSRKGRTQKYPKRVKLLNRYFVIVVRLT